MYNTIDLANKNKKSVEEGHSPSSTVDYSSSNYFTNKSNANKNKNSVEEWYSPSSTVDFSSDNYFTKKNNENKAKSYLTGYQSLVNDYNSQLQKFSGDQWKSGDEMIQSIQSAQKIKNKADILMGDISKNKDMFVQTYGQDVYDAVLGGFKDISKSTNNLLNYERDMNGVYKQFDSKEAYDRHVTLSKSTSADIQKQIDELNAQIETEQEKYGAAKNKAWMNSENPFYIPKSDYDFDAAEKTLTELTSYLNNARKRELAEKYKIDVDSLSYSEMKKELESSARRNPEKYDYLKQYYDSMGESYWADRQAEDFVSGLSDEAKELYKQASEFLRMPHSTGDRHLPYVKRQIMEKTGIGEEELENNLSLASRYFNAKNRKDTQEKIVSMVNEHPVLNSVLLNLPTPVMNLLGGISAAADQTLQTISNQVSGKDTPIDTNTSGQAIYNISNDIRSATRDKIAEIKQPSLPKALGGQKLGVFAYDTLMSGVDSLVSMGAGGLAGLGAGVTGNALNHTVSAITGVIMGSNAAAGTVQDSLEKGYSNWQSLGRGFASGLAESLTEHIGTEVLLDAVIKGGSAGKAILKSALSEGTEEVANNVLNGAIDWVFNGHEGRVTSLYKQYLSEGYTKKTAMSKAWEDVIGEDAGTFLSAAITGAVFGASGTAANSVYESETVKQIQNSIDNQIGGAGQANFLRGIQSLMKEAEAAGTNEDADAIRTHAVNAISDRITWILDNADSVSQNSVMLRKLGEEKVNADAAKMRKNAETLTAVRDSIKNGTYDSDLADYLIDINDSSVASDALESSSGQKRIKKAAETYMKAYNGNVSEAMDALFNTQKILNDSEKSLTAEKNNLSKSLASENTEAAKKSSDRISEIDSELKKISLEKKNASDLMAYAQKTFAMDVKNMLGKSAPNVKMDYTMKKEEEAKYNRSTGQISVNPYAILLAQSQMDTNARSNAARVKVVHEAGHAAAQADASFVPQVYAVYRELRENGLVTDVDVNEANITETYRNAGVLNAYLNTPSVQKQISSLVKSGMSESAARDAMVQAYMQEEYVMNFLEYVEKSGGKVYERLLPEQKNVFVRAMQKIAELFRRIAAKIRGTDTSAAGKLENTAERILAAVREFAGGGGEVTAANEAETVQGGRNMGDAGNDSSAVSVAADGGERLSLAKEFSDIETRYSIRVEEPPKKTGIAYKVFLAKDGGLYPPMVANPNGEPTPVGVWLNADVGKSAPPSKTGRLQVQGGGKGTNSGKISLAFRPGWHLGDIPLAKQFAQLNPETGIKELFPENFVWAECEYAMDVDYQDEAMSYGYTENGKFRHSYAGLPRIPVDGYYRYRTNPNPDTVPWIITGAMRVRKILTDAETDAICREHGVEPMKRKGGEINLEKYGLHAGETTNGDDDGAINISETADVEERLSLASPVEETKDLLAVHNMTEANLRGALQLGGLPMPSIAIVKRDAGHSEYGPISVLFRRETIDPASDRRNRVYGGDAWTPVFPRVEYKANKKVEKRVRDKYYELSRKYGYESTLAMQSYEQDLSEKLTSAGGEAAMLENLYGDEDMMQIYLEDTGKGRVENVVREEKTILTDEQARQYDILIDTLGREEMNRFAVKDGESPMSVRKAFLKRNESGIREAFARTFKESGMDAKTADEVSGELDRRDLMKYVREAYKYMLNGRETVKHEIDYAATKDAIREKAGSGYREWVRDLFGGAEEKSGIRNNKEMFTASGNRRSFDALHYELTLENVVRAMREEEQKGGGTIFGGQSIWGAATKDYGSIGEVKADSGRLGTVSEDEYKAIRQKYTGRFVEIANEIMDSGADNSFIAADDAAEILVDVLRKRKTVAAIDRELRKYSQLNIQNDTAQKAYDLFRDISNMPTEYFEAKPQRAVGFDEAAAVVVPQSTDSALTDELRSAGVRVETYTDGDEAARLDTLNRVADEERDVRFSLASPVKEQSDNIGTFDPNNQDIRYSISNESDTIDKLKARIQEDNEFLRHQTGRTEKTKWKKALTPAAVDRLTEQIRKTWGIAKSDENRLRPMFGIADECFNGKISYDEAFDRMRAMAKEILSDVYELDDSYMKQNEDFIRYIKSMTFSVPSENESDLSGGYAAYRRENAKYIKLSRSGTPIDSVYEEICGLFPGMLDPEAANPADQVQEIVEAMRSMEPETVRVYSDVIRDASESLVADVMSKYERGARETYSAYRDRMEKQNVESERKRTAREYGRELNTTVTAYEARIARIEADAARASDEYAKLLDQSRLREREANWNTTRREMAARIRVQSRALHSAAVSPTQKRFVPEAYRQNVDRIANWMRETANNTTGRTNSAYLSGGIREDIRALGGLFGEDFTDTANLLLDMADDAAAVNVEDTNSGSAVHVLRSVSQLGSMMRKMLADQNRAYLDGKRVNALDTGADIVEHLNKRKLAEKEFSNIETDQKGRIKTDSGYGLRNIFRNRFMLNAMSGYDFLHRLGGAGDKLYETLRESQSEQVMHVKEYTDYLSEKLIYDKKNNADGVKLSDYIGDKQKMIRVQLSGGRNISMTAAQAMSIVTLYEREAGRSHIEQGGVRLIHPESRKVSAPIALTEEDIRSIRGKLDKNDLRVMNVMNAFIRDKCTAWGNEATMEKYGFKRFTTADYFPIFVDKNSLPANMSADQARNAVQFNVENVGFAKSAKDNASAPLLVDSFIDVINRHVEGMATYAAYLNSEDTVNRIMSAPGVRDAMQRSLGSNSVQFMQEVMSELKGAGRYTSISDSIAEWWKRGSGVYKSAAVSFNASTAAKQPLSYVRAAAVISPKYLTRGMHLSTRGGEAHSQMMKYSGIGVKKNMGYSDVGVARNLGAQIGYEKENLKKAIQDFNELGMYGAAKMDEITWDALWIACREEVLEKNPGISLDTEKWMNATAKRFSRVIAQTQVVDSPLDSSRVMRSSNPFVRNIMAFQNEPLKGFNLMVNALDDLINAEKGSTAQKEAGKAFASSVSVNVIGNVLEAVVSCAFRALRDDDDDFTGAVKANFGAEMLSNSLGLLPGVSQLYDLIYDALHGYDYNDMGISVLTDMVGSVYDLVRTAENPDRKQETVFKQVRDLAESVATFCGVPLRNIDRMLVNAAKAFFHVTNMYAAEYTMQKIFYNPSSALARERHEFASLLVDAYEAGDVRSYEYIYNDMEKRGVKPKSILSSLAKHMGEETTDKDSLVKFQSGSDGWYLAMQSIFNRRIDDTRATEEEITRVYDATNNTSLLPKFKDGTYSVTVYDENGKKNTENRSFTGEEYVSYLDEYGSLLYDIANAMRDLPEYRRGSDNEKAWWLTKAEVFAAAVSIYHRDGEYNYTNGGKWIAEYAGKRPVEVAKYIVKNLSKES